MLIVASKFCVWFNKIMKQPPSSGEVSTLRLQTLAHSDEIAKLYSPDLLWEEACPESVCAGIVEDFKGLRQELLNEEYSPKRSNLAYSAGFVALYAVRASIVHTKNEPDYWGPNSWITDQLRSCDWPILDQLVSEDTESVVTDDDEVVKHLYETFDASVTDIRNAIWGKHEQRISEEMPYKTHGSTFKQAKIPEKELIRLLREVTRGLLEEEGNSLFGFDSAKAITVLEHIFDVASAKSLLDHSGSDQITLKEQAVNKARYFASPENLEQAIKYLSGFERMLETDPEAEE